MTFFEIYMDTSAYTRVGICGVFLFLCGRYVESVTAWCWAVLVLFIFMMIERRELSNAVRASLARRTTTLLEMSRESEKQEPAEWLNVVLQKAFSVMHKEFSAYLYASLKDVVPTLAPELVHSLKLSALDIGPQAPIVSGITIHQFTSFGNELDTFEVDLSFEWNIDLKVVVVARLMKVSVPVKAENLSISGNLRLGITMDPNLFVRKAVVSFLTRPALDVSIKASHVNVDLVGIGALEQAIQTAVVESLDFMIWPHMFTYDAAVAPPARRTVSVTIVSASNLIAADRNGFSDPYVVMTATRKCQTRVIKKTLYPVWNQTFTFNVPDVETAVIDFEVFDEDPMADDTLGTLHIQLRDLFPDEIAEMNAKHFMSLTTAATETRESVDTPVEPPAAPVELASSNTPTGSRETGSSDRGVDDGGGIGRDGPGIFPFDGDSSDSGMTIDSELGYPLGEMPSVGEEEDVWTRDIVRKLAHVDRGELSLSIRVQEWRELPPPGHHVSNAKLQAGDHDGVLRVGLVKGDSLMRMSNKFRVDNSDPYVVMDCGGVVHQSVHIKNTVNPEWGEMFVFVISDVDHDELMLRVMDWELTKKDRVMGDLVVPLTEIVRNHNDGRQVTFRLENCTSGTVTLKFMYSGSLPGHRLEVERHRIRGERLHEIAAPEHEVFMEGLIEGILEKRGKRFKQWKKRYFYVSKRDGALWYFKPREPKPHTYAAVKGNILLQGATIHTNHPALAKLSKKKATFAFVIVGKDNRTSILRATELTFSFWVDAIQEAIDGAELGATRANLERALQLATNIEDVSDAGSRVGDVTWDDHSCASDRSHNTSNADTYGYRHSDFSPSPIPGRSRSVSRDPAPPIDDSCSGDGSGDFGFGASGRAEAVVEAVVEGGVGRSESTQPRRRSRRRRSDRHVGWS